MWWRVLIWMSFGIPFLWIALLIHRGKGRMNRWYLHGFSSIAYGFLVWGLTMTFIPVMFLLPVNTNMKIYLLAERLGLVWFSHLSFFPFGSPTS